MPTSATCIEATRLETFWEPEIMEIPEISFLWQKSGCLYQQRWLKQLLIVVSEHIKFFDMQPKFHNILLIISQSFIRNSWAKCDDDWRWWWLGSLTSDTKLENVILSRIFGRCARFAFAVSYNRPSIHWFTFLEYSWPKKKQKIKIIFVFYVDSGMWRLLCVKEKNDLYL